jgi:hypothetical protein
MVRLRNPRQRIQHVVMDRHRKRLELLLNEVLHQVG